MLFRYLTLGICAIVQLHLLQSAHAQLSTQYTPEQITDTIPPEIEKKILARLQGDQASVREPDARVQKYLKQLYKDRADYVIGTFNGDYLMVDSEITHYLQEILISIYKANPSLSNETSVYAYRSDAVNAMSFGEGTIGFSLGLLLRLENEAQVAFVICHELAHYHQKHSDEKLQKIAKLNFDRDVNRQVQRIVRSDYEKYSKLSHLRMTLQVDITQHGREHEVEADSIALHLFSNTKYDRRAPVGLLEILDKADPNEAFAPIDFKKVFNFSDYPFKEKWLVQPKNDFVYAHYSMPDNLRTHPDCKKRIELLRRGNIMEPEQNSALESNTRFAAVLSKAKYELCASLYHFEQYGKALYYYLMLDTEQADDVYVNAMIAICLHRLYQSQVNHELARTLQLPDPRFPDSYNRFLNFIHALRTPEVGALGFWHAATKMILAPENELMLFTCWLASNTESTQPQHQGYKSQYLEKFPYGGYRNQIEKKSVLQK